MQPKITFVTVLAQRLHIFLNQHIPHMCRARYRYLVEKLKIWRKVFCFVLIILKYINFICWKLNIIKYWIGVIDGHWTLVFILDFEEINNLFEYLLQNFEAFVLKIRTIHGCKYIPQYEDKWFCRRYIFFFFLVYRFGFQYIYWIRIVNHFDELFIVILTMHNGQLQNLILWLQFCYGFY